jgi:hypothetical protein
MADATGAVTPEETSGGTNDNHTPPARSTQGTRQGRQNTRGTPTMSSANKNFEGAEPGVGAVLGLRYEKIDKKVTYEVFREKMSNYIERTMKYGDDVVCLIKDYEDPIESFEMNNMPEELSASDKENSVKVAIQQQRIKLYVSKEADLINNVQAIYSKIWGQCSEGLQNVVKYNDMYKVKEKEKDVVWLLKTIKKATTGLDDMGNPRVIYFNALKAFVNMRQGGNEGDESYLRRCKAAVETLILAGGRHVLSSPQIIDCVDAKNPSKEEVRREEEKFSAIHVLQTSDPVRYNDLNEELKNASYVGRDDYPTTISSAYELMIRRSGRYQAIGTRDNGRRGQSDINHRRRQLQFLQHDSGSNATNDDEALVPGRDGTVCDLVCYYCHQAGHVSNNCPNIPLDRVRSGGGGGRGRGRGRGGGHGGGRGTGLFQCSVGFTQSDEDIIPASWLLLDTCSTSSVCRNADLVSAIRPCKDSECLTVYTNGGSKSFDQIGMLKALPLPVHFNADSMANILAIKDVASIPGVRLTMDSSKERAIIVEYGDELLKFDECQDGLYFYDTNKNKPKPAVTNYSMLQTVADNKDFFSANEIQGADRARKIQQQIGWPSTSHFKSIVSKQLLLNCNITIDDINRAELIYGPPTPILQGKMTRQKPQSVKIERIPLPLPISKHHKNLQLYVDFFFVNGYPFLATKSAKVNFITAQPVTSRSTAQIIKHIDTVINKYEARGFTITAIHGDNEFNINDLKKHVLPTLVHIYGKDEHVGAIERLIRVIKERSRCMCHAIPYKHYTKLMIQSLIACVTKWLNAFPGQDGISSTMSPSMIVEGRPNPDFNHKRIVFGSYALVYTGTDNTMEARSVPAIALQESNDHGGHYFMNLYTGKRLHAYKWTELPIDDDVIDMVKQLATAEKGPIIKSKYPMFEWAPGIPIEDEVTDIAHDDDDNDDDTIEQNNDVNENNEMNVNDNEVVINDENDVFEQIAQQDNNENENENEQIYITEDEEDNDIDNTNIEQEEDDDIMHESDDVLPPINEHVEERSEDSDSTSTNETTESKERESTESEERTYANQRPRRENAGLGVDTLEMSFDGKSYTHGRHRQFMMVKENYDINQDMDSYMSLATKVMFTQMNAKKGIKRFGERAIAAMFKEYKQMDEGPMPGKPVFGVCDSTKLSWEEKRQALEAVNLIKEKRCGKIKGRTCANGSKQRQYLKEDESVYSPTCSTESLLSTAVIDAFEKRDVAIFDVPGAFLQTEMPKDKNVIMIIRDEFVDIMCEVNPEYIPYVITDKNGRKVLYVKILRAIYGCIESALLWYELYTKTLKDMGFVLNPYDRCVANKVINGKQCTIVFYVDDNKLSHVDPNVVTEILDKISEHFGDLVITRGKTHDFLGMTMTFRDDNKVELDMIKKLEESLESFPSRCGYKVTSPCSPHLWNVNENAERLSKEQSELFHSTTAKLLYMTKRTRPDIEPAVAFFTTRVHDSSVDDWKKLVRCMTYLEQTKDDKRVIGCFNLNELFTWVDASFAVHPNMRSHTGGTMSMGYGMLHCRSSKQKLNTKSTTESELVGTSEYVPFNIWMLLFWGEQGYKINKNILFQDNASAIRMQKNGRASCTGNSRHIDIKHFFVKDRIDKDEIEVKFCPTHLMIADYFTKPLQGKQFKLLRDYIMGYVHINELLKEIDRLAKERVENNKNVTKRSNRNKSKPRVMTYAEVAKCGIGKNKERKVKFHVDSKT